MPGEPHERDVVERGDGLAVDDRVDGQPGFGGVGVPVDRGQRVGQVGHVDLGQEAQLAQVHPEHREALAVGQPHRAQHRAVAAQADEQVRLLAHLLGGHRLGGAGQPAQLVDDAEDPDAPPVRPVEDRADRAAAVALGMQQQPHHVHGDKLPRNLPRR